MQTRSTVNNMLKYANFVESGAGKLGVDSFDGASFTGTNFVATSEIIME